MARESSPRGISVRVAKAKVALPMKIEIDKLGTPRRDFIQLRDELIAQGKRFDENTLPSIPYEKLVGCCTGPAGAAACSLRLVRAEKLARRERFLDMQPDELAEANNFLRVEQMYDDVERERAKQAAPRWDELTNRQKLWFKLNCVFNHLDYPLQRLLEAITILRHWQEESESGVPREACEHYITKLRQLYHDYARLTNHQFREKLWGITESVLEFLPDSERNICEREELQDFRCTSDCFRVLP